MILNLATVKDIVSVVEMALGACCISPEQREKAEVVYKYMKDCETAYSLPPEIPKRKNG